MPVCDYENANSLFLMILCVNICNFIRSSRFHCSQTGSFKPIWIVTATQHLLAYHDSVCSLRPKDCVWTARFHTSGDLTGIMLTFALIRPLRTIKGQSRALYFILCSMWRTFSQVHFLYYAAALMNVDIGHSVV